MRDLEKMEETSLVMALTGNKSAAYGAMLSRPDVCAAYPITPQTSLVEHLSTFIADGLLDASMMTIEGEHSALSVLQGAALAGSRVFTGTSSQGLFFMNEPYNRQPTLRLPMVMVIVGREQISPQTVWGSQQDSMIVRDAGWIQLYAEDNQEILDSIIMGYKVAEKEDVLLPVNVCYDGFYLSLATEKVYVPDQKLVDEFLPPYESDHIKLDPDNPMSVDPLTPGGILMEYRYKHVQGMKASKKAWKEVDEEFGEIFGRNYGGLIELYKMEDADIGLITVGSPTGTARVAIDKVREEGINVGLIKIRVFRPFPREEIIEAARNLDALGIFDRNVCFGWGTGIGYMETRSALKDLSDPPLTLSFIGGLGGSDVLVSDFEKMIKMVSEAARKGEVDREVIWFIK